MKYLYYKDLKKRKRFFFNEHKVLIFKYLKLYLPGKIKSMRYRFYRKYSQTMVKNKCLLSTRNRSIFQFFGLSRMFIRFKGSFGFLNGLRKSSW